MFFTWLKRLTPRSLYGRAALILLVPVVVIQLVVSVLFIQRHYEGITRQMTGTFAAEIAFVISVADRAPDLVTAQQRVAELVAPMAATAYLPAPPLSGELRDFSDLSGRTLVSTLKERVPELTFIDLSSDERFARLQLSTDKGVMEVSVQRRRLAPAVPHQLLVMMLLTSITMTVIAFLFLRNQLRPVKRLAAAAEAFGRGRMVPFKPSGATEMRAVGVAFMDMRARIDRMLEQRTLMLSGVSHDLRTPLTRMKLELAMMDPDEVAPLLGDIAEMEKLVDSFLDFARGEANEAAEPTDPVELARAAVADAVRGGGNVILAESEPTGIVPLRSASVRRALDNLIGNALRYAGRAEVSVYSGERAIRIVVEDDGPGIPEAQRDEALLPFTRLDPSRNQNRGAGVGLGLAIARDIARRHGGVLRLRDSARLGGLKAELILAR